jgi:hypothetical protein
MPQDLNLRLLKVDCDLWIWTCLSSSGLLKASCHRLHGKNYENVNIFSDRESGLWYLTCAAVSPATIPGSSVVRTYTLLWVGFRCCPKQLVRVWRGPQRWDFLSLLGLFYSCSCCVFVYILWCGDSENNLAIVSHYLQEVLNELT